MYNLFISSFEKILFNFLKLLLDVATRRDNKEKKKFQTSK